ncbi:cytochrome d ubiquinol oxidase subunit II [Rhodobacteraceae bacterium RKSG542]|uniref:cytochrome d ubiquinol oxidase subunit II n=1 Tax=Pseudovibrio flavus TaxID=2529854 RepID=UPI0012BBE00A|nr:cytochrome d ubiquinol oxidase subunit II [Pseudovibrio flavus]MTI15845.1 cytochrome d ubiquinol oxidase subunit II [Pseudovibrio flavus]
MVLDYPLIWGFLIAVAIFIYVVLDGFDLGIGILYPTTKDDEERTLMMNTVAPVWDGNETWLILGGGGLFAVFPLAYSVIMPALYMPIIMMLIGLIFRGVAFEYRFKASAERRYIWDFSFFAGSVLAALSQGIALGALIEGITVEDRAYAGGWFDWLSPFSIATGLALISGYALLGSTWLIMKLEGKPQQHFRRVARPCALILLGFIVLVSVWMPFIDPDAMKLYFTAPFIYYTVPVPVLVAALAFVIWQGINNPISHARAFVSTLLLFLVTYIGLGISIYPDVVPHRFSIWEAAAPDSSLKFLLVGAVVLIPLILAYTAYSYWVFRGKVRSGEGYH